MDKLQLFVLILGLIATAQSVIAEDDESPDFCGEIIRYTEFGESVQVTSPGYPAQYNIATSCMLTLILETSTPSVLGISQYIPSSAGCSVPYDITNSAGDQLPNQYINCSTSNDRTLYTNNLVIKTNSTFEVGVSLPAGSGDAFTFTFSVLPLLTMQPSDSKYKVDVMSTPAAYIVSHQGFGEMSYRLKLMNQLTLQNLADVSAVTLDFVLFNLGTLAGCAGQPYDVFKVFGNEKSYPLYDCGDTSNKPPQQILDTRSYNSLLFEFVTDSESVYNGFLLQYSVTTVNGADNTTTAASSTTIAETTSTSVPSSSSTSAPTTISTSQPMTSTTHPMTSATQPPTSTTPNSFSESSSTNPEQQTKTTDTHPTLTSTSQPANDMVVTAVGVAAGIAGFIVGVVVTLLTQLLYQRCRGDTSGKTQTDSLEAADEPAPEYMIPTVQLDVLTSTRQDVDTTGVDTADVTHRYSYVDLPIASLPATAATSSNEYMTLNTTSISIADAAEEQNINDAHLYDTLQNTGER